MTPSPTPPRNTLTVTKWGDPGDCELDEDDDEQAYDDDLTPVTSYVSEDGSSWYREDRSDGDELDLWDILDFKPSEVVSIEFVGPDVSLADIVSGLPTDDEYAEESSSEKTGLPVLDAIVEREGARVLINGVRWIPFYEPFELSGGGMITWCAADPDELLGGFARPAHRRVLMDARGCELDSPTSGASSWRLLELDDSSLCLVSDIDGENTSFDFFDIGDKDVLADVIADNLFAIEYKWPEMARAIEHALAIRRDFNGVASQLDPDLSDTCELNVEFDDVVFAAKT